MSRVSPALPDARRSAPPAPRAGDRRRYWFIGLLLAAEFALLVTRFSTATLRAPEDTWSAWMMRAGIAPQIVLLSAVALLFLRRTHLETEFTAWRAALAGPRLGVPRVALHLAAFAGLYVTSAHVFEDQGAPALWAWRIAWCAAIALTAATGLALFAPFAAWWRAVRATSVLLAGAALLAVAAWGLGTWAQRGLGPALRGPTQAAAGAVLGLFSGDVHSDPDEFILGTGSFQVRVAPQCSGFEGIGLIVVFTAAYLWVERRRLWFPRALVLPLAGIALAWLLNLARLVGLILVGTHVSPRLAVEGFHSLVGLVFFSALALGLVWTAQRSRWLTHSGYEVEEPRGQRPTPAFLLPFLSIVAVATVAQAFGGLAPALYPLRLAPAVLLLIAYRRHYERLGWRPTLAGWIGGATVFGLWSWLAGPGSSADQGLEGEAGPVWVAFRIVGFVAIVPLCEELAFRGYLMRRMTSAAFEGVAPGSTSVAAWIGSSLLFALAHGGDWLAALLAGLVYGWLYRRSGRIGDAVVGHALTNALFVGAGAWSGSHPEG